MQILSVKNISRSYKPDYHECKLRSCTKLRISPLSASSNSSYRDGITHQSILSALSASYNGIGELSYYEDLAKNIDANLAEVDMESFRTEDIHSLLTTNSAEFRHSRHRNNNRGESGTAASRSGLELNLAGIGGHNGMDSSEICKSELLFSPVKESHISVDSLDMDGYPDEDDIILTCQANKNNYTIAFEQSALYSDESFYGEWGLEAFKFEQIFIAFALFRRSRELRQVQADERAQPPGPADSPEGPGNGNVRVGGGLHHVEQAPEQRTRTKVRERSLFSSKPKIAGKSLR